MNTTSVPASAATLAESRPAQPPAGTATDTLARLADYFPPEWVKFKPQTVKGNRALAVAYIDARIVQSWLDDILGPGNWQDDYEILPGGSVLCRLRIRTAGEWVTKTDVGSPSEQPDVGDKLKAAFSDALKRAAVKWGVGRYLYELPAVWCDYDLASRQFRQLPQLPQWARPPAITTEGKPVTSGNAPALPEKPKSKMPTTGAELVARLKQFEAAAVAKRLCRPGDLFDRVARWCQKAGHASDLAMLDAAGIAYAVDVVKDWNDDIKARQTQQDPAASKANPNSAAVGVRQNVLNVLREHGKVIEREFKEPLDKWLSRQHDRLTFKELVDKPDVWGVDAISALATELKRYIDSSIPD